LPEICFVCPNESVAKQTSAASSDRILLM